MTVQKMRCKCGRAHRTYNKVAKCVWPKAWWYSGEGAFALIAFCGGETVTLWKTLAEAEEKEVLLRGTRCGGSCAGDHMLAELVR